MMTPESTESQYTFMTRMSYASCSDDVMRISAEYSACLGTKCPESLGDALLLWRNAIFREARKQKPSILENSELSSYLLMSGLDDGAQCYGHIVNLIYGPGDRSDRLQENRIEKMLLGAASLINAVLTY